MNIQNLTQEEKVELAKRMFTPVKICNAYLSSKTHNDIVRRANPTWSDEQLSFALCNESCYDKAVELEKKLEYITDFVGERRGHKIYKTTATITINHPLAGKDFQIYGDGDTEEKALNNAKEMAIHFLEVNFLEDEKIQKQYATY